MNDVLEFLFDEFMSPFNFPVITDSTGKVEYGYEDFDFDYSDRTEVYYSCSITYRGEFYVFGGEGYQRQISKLEGCLFQRVGVLSFDFAFGACAAAP